MFRQLKNDNSGVILATVLIIIVAMTILMMATVSINTTEVQKLESFADDFIAEKISRTKVLGDI